MNGETEHLDRRRQLHWDLAERLREQIRRELRPGDSLASVRELVRQWGVSVAVVRSAQALLCQEGLLEVRHGAGAVVTERAGQRRVVLYSELDLLHLRVPSFHAMLVRELRDRFEREGIQTEFLMGRTQPGETIQEPTCPAFVEGLRDRSFDGVVLVDRPVTGSWDRLVRDATMPMVGAGTPYAVDYDYQEFVTEGVRQLACQGAERLAMLSWAQGAYEGNFAEAVAAFHLETRPGWLRHDLHPQLAGAGWEEFREVWAAHPEKPDGLLVCDDVLFGEAAIAIAELGIGIPEQLRIVSHRTAGNPARYPFPVTWIEFEPAKAAEVLAEMMMQRLEDTELPPCKVKLPFAVHGAEAAPPSGRGNRSESLDSVDSLATACRNDGS